MCLTVISEDRKATSPCPCASGISAWVHINFQMLHVSTLESFQRCKNTFFISVSFFPGSRISEFFKGLIWLWSSFANLSVRSLICLQNFIGCLLHFRHSSYKGKRFIQKKLFFCHSICWHFNLLKPPNQIKIILPSKNTAKRHDFSLNGVQGWWFLERKLLNNWSTFVSVNYFCSSTSFLDFSSTNFTGGCH